MHSNLERRSQYVIGALAGLSYNSWPLGYWLNPEIGRHDLASTLEASHQPYRLVFVLGDIISGLLVTLLAWSLSQLPHTHRRDLLRTAWIGLHAFGIGTIFDALLPLHCDPSVSHCSLLDPLLLSHGILSIAASFGLFLAIIALWVRDHRHRVLLATIVGYLLFGVFSLVSVLLPGQDSWAQHYSLLLDGICLLVVPHAVYNNSDRQSKKLTSPISGGKKPPSA